MPVNSVILQTMILKLVEKRKETRSVTSFIFQPENPFKWAAGQYLIYKLAHENEDLRGRTRFFTISSSPFEKNPSITTRITKSSSSFKKALNSLKPGDIIEAKGPDGDFVVDSFTKTHVFIAGGIGITPYISILKQLVKSKKKVRIILFYANKNKQIPFKKDLDEISAKDKDIKVNYVLSPRKINSFMLKKHLIPGALYYISGPDAMVEDITRELIKLGVKEKNIKNDYFSGYKSI